MAWRGFQQFGLASGKQPWLAFSGIHLKGGPEGFTKPAPNSTRIHITSSQAQENGSTPLHLAAFHGQTEVVHLLLQAGAEKDRRFCDVEPLSNQHCTSNTLNPRSTRFRLGHSIISGVILGTFWDLFQGKTYRKSAQDTNRQRHDSPAPRGHRGSQWCDTTPPWVWCRKRQGREKLGGPKQPILWDVPTFCLFYAFNVVSSPEKVEYQCKTISNWVIPSSSPTFELFSPTKTTQSCTNFRKLHQFSSTSAFSRHPTGVPSIFHPGIPRDLRSSWPKIQKSSVHHA